MPVRPYRKRYLALKLEGSRPEEGEELLALVLDALVELFGESGAAGARLKLIEYDAGRGVAILRCSHTHMGLVRASLASITANRAGQPLAIHVVDASGTLRALRKRLPTRAR